MHTQNNRGVRVASHVAGPAARVCAARARGFSWLAEHAGDPAYAERMRLEAQAWNELRALAELERRYS